MKQLLLGTFLLPVLLSISPAFGQYGQRLIASSRYVLMGSGELAFYDSTFINYHNRKWSFEYDYDWMEYPLYIRSPMDFPDYSFPRLDNKLPDCSLIGSYNKVGSPMHLADDKTFEYDDIGRLLTYSELTYTNDSVVAISKFIYNYDFSGNVTRLINVNWDSKKWDTLATKWLRYDLENRLAQDSDDYAPGVIKQRREVTRKYTHNQDGKLEQISAIYYSDNSRTNQDWRKFSYDSNGRLVLSQRFNGTGLVSIDSLNYSGNAGYYNSCILQYYQNEVLRTDLYIVKHIGGNGLPDEMTYYDGNNRRLYKLVFRYNSLNNIFEQDEIGMDTYGQPTSYSLRKFYYEDAPDTAGKNLIPFGIAAYPNPTHDNLYVTWRNAGANTLYNMQLYNTIGQILFSKTVNWLGVTEVIPMQHFADGIYYLRVGNGDKKQLLIEKINKN